MARLTAQQELFAQAVFQGVGLGKAYKDAGYKAVDRNTQDSHASRLARNGKIVERMQELAQARAISEKVTVQTVTNMLADVYEDARKFKQIGAAATAAMGIAKLHGLLVDRVEDITRRPARDPGAPLEIEVEHWLTDHKLLGGPAATEPAATEPAATDHKADMARAPTQLDLFSEEEAKPDLAIPDTAPAPPEE
jgi:hypothetical protein